MWKDLRMEDVHRVDGEKLIRKIQLEVLVEGLTQGKRWGCGFEFDYTNSESMYCRPTKFFDSGFATNLVIPQQAVTTPMAFLPPMSGLAAIEAKLEPGRINVLIGEGQTAQVLRNLCHDISVYKPELWTQIVGFIEMSFGARLDKPQHSKARGELTMTYSEGSISELDISAAGRGLQQTLLLLSYLYSNPNSVLLLDEPDAHLEIIRQREVYDLLKNVASETKSQIIAASHSEVVLTEAAQRDTVIAFLGKKPHKIDSHFSELRKALNTIRFVDYYQAEQKGWILYLEGATDLAILQRLARKLSHEAAEYLGNAFVYYTAETKVKPSKHFFGLRGAKKDVLGIAVYDNLARLPGIGDESQLVQLMWNRREIENYICSPSALKNYARSLADDNGELQGIYENAMIDAISDRVPHAALNNPDDKFWLTTKASDDFLDVLFPEFYAKADLPILLSKSNYYLLADFIDANEIDREVMEKLDEIARIAKKARPAV